MKNVFLQYNPFTIDTIVKIDGEPFSINGEQFSNDGKLYSYRGRRLQEWICNLFSKLEKECNEDFKLTFKGTELDYNDIVIAKRDYDKTVDPNKVKVYLEAFTFAESAKERLDKLD